MNEAMAVVVVVGILALVVLGFVLGFLDGGAPDPNAASPGPDVAARSGRRKSSGGILGSGMAGSDGGADGGWGGGDSGGGDGGGGSC